MYSIYKITSPDGLVYIGKSKNVKRRMLDYRWLGKKTETQRLLYSSLLTHGFKNHTFDIIEELSDVEESNIREIFHISIYMEKGKSLNVLKGGGFMRDSIKRPVIQFNINGDYISEYESLRHAEKITGISYSNIAFALSKKRYYSHGYNWMYREDYLKNGKPDFSLNKSCRQRPVKMFDKHTGEFVQEFKSPLDTHKGTGIARASILNCLNGQCKTSNGYIFRYTHQA